MPNTADEIIRSYIEKSIEHLMEIENHLTVVHWCQDAIDEETVNKILMKVRYVQDGASVMELKEVESLAHAIETRVDLMRNEKLISISRTISALLLAAHELREVLANITTSNIANTDAYRRLLQHLHDY